MKPNAKLWAAIREKGWSQRDFCKVVGDDPATVSRAVTGKLNLDIPRQIKWAKALGKPQEELFAD